VPAIEELIIITRGLILLEGEDEFMFACAHCCQSWSLLSDMAMIGPLYW
jgi:hypothetical protein